MIITSASPFTSEDIPSYCWSRLRQFHNTEWVTEQLIRLHKVDKGQYNNVKKQAQQIKYCLIQAKEYYEAARIVSLATKPVLMYYCIMSLALAEILLKQDGRSSLDVARGDNAHHGLIVKVQPMNSAHAKDIATLGRNLRRFL